MTDESSETRNFIRNIIDEDLVTGKFAGKVMTRFPPEPNGYLHIGHAKSICLNFGVAEDYKRGTCNLRFDDTNPTKEDERYVEAIKEDIKWLGYDWGDGLHHASDYFDKLYEYALQLIKQGRAYVCGLSAEELKEYRGTLTEAGRNSPYRDAAVAQNLKLFQEMKEGLHEEGKYVLRAKIDMASGNMNMRDPTIYRIRKVSHQRTGDQWCVYPMYDFTHCLSDALENITHSLCTLEFQDHRPLYDWFLETLGTESRPQQIEFARLNLDYTVTSKRKLGTLVEKNFVAGWDDPRLPTLCGMRRRGYPPEAVRHFCDRIGISKKDTVISIGILEDCVRESLNETAQRRFALLKPLRVILENWGQDEEETLEAPNHPQKPEMGKRPLTFSREIFIDRDDFSEAPVKGFNRLSLGGEVRLRYGYIIRCDSVDRDSESGEIKALYCTVDRDTLGKKPEGRKVKGVIHWLSSQDARGASVNVYDRLFLDAEPGKGGKDFLESYNQDSLLTIESALVEANATDENDGLVYQFERLGYFCRDQDSKQESPVFNRTVTLRDTWK